MESYSNTSNNKILSIFFISAILLTLPCISRAQETIGRFTYIEGIVKVYRNNSTPGVDTPGVELLVKKGDPVYRNDIVVTEEDSKAKIRFKDDSVIRLAQNSRMKIDKYNDDKRLMSLPRGKVRFVVSSLKRFDKRRGRPISFEVKTPTAVVGVRGTDFIVLQEKDGMGTFVKEGNVNVAAIEGEFIRYVQKEMDEYEKFQRELKKEFEDYRKEMEKGFKEFVKEFDLSEMSAVMIVGNEIKKLDFKEVEKEFEELDF